MPANPDPDHTILSYSISKLGRAISVADDFLNQHRPVEVYGHRTGVGLPLFTKIMIYFILEVFKVLQE